MMIATGAVSTVVHVYDRDRKYAVKYNSLCDRAQLVEPVSLGSAEQVTCQHCLNALRNIAANTGVPY